MHPPTRHVPESGRRDSEWQGATARVVQYGSLDQVGWVLERAACLWFSPSSTSSAAALREGAPDEKWTPVICLDGGDAVWEGPTAATFEAAQTAARDHAPSSRQRSDRKSRQQPLDRFRRSASSNGRCTVPVMMTGAVDRDRPLETPGSIANNLHL